MARRNLMPLTLQDFDALGVLACGDGEEEKDATEVSRHGVVDEEETTSFTIEAESPPV